MRVFARPTSPNFVKKSDGRNFVLDNAKLKRPEVSDRTTFPARGKILFVDMETLPSIADTTRVTKLLSYLSSRRLS